MNQSCISISSNSTPHDSQRRQYYPDFQSQYVHDVYYRRKKGNREKGILRVELNLIQPKGKKITWIPDVTTQNLTQVEIIGTEISDVEKQTKEKDKSELLYIQTKKSNQFVFIFLGENNSFSCQLFYDLIKYSKEEFFYKRFQMLPLLDKKKVLLIRNDEYLTLLFREICNRYRTVSFDLYWYLVKKLYLGKITEWLNESEVQLSHKTELCLKDPQFIFNYQHKYNLIKSNENIKKIYDDNILRFQSDGDFWKLFLKNQFQKGTEIVGGYQKVEFNKDESEIIQRVPIGGNEKGKRSRIAKRFENVEKHMNYIDNYEGNCIMLKEYDYRAEKLEHEDKIEKNEMRKLISSINEYSHRKIEKINYIPALKLKFQCDEIRNRNLIRQHLIFTNKKIEDDVEMVDVYAPKKMGSILAKLEEMKKNKRSEEKAEDTFRRINGKFLENTKRKKICAVQKEIGQKVKEILNDVNLYRDLKYIFELFKDKLNINIEDIKKLIKEVKKKIVNEKNMSSNLVIKELIDSALAIYPINYENI